MLIVSSKSESFLIALARSVTNLTRHKVRVALIMSAPYATIPTITTNERGQIMTLDEYKQLVEAQRLASLAVALEALSKSSAIAKEMNK